MVSGLRGGEQDVWVNDPWRQLGRRYDSQRRDNTVPDVQVQRPGPDTQGFYNRLARTLDISSAANRLQDTKTQIALEKRALEEAKYLQDQWGSIDLSGVNPQFLEQNGLRGHSGPAGAPSGKPLQGSPRTTATFGQSGKHWKSTHTGIDFAVPIGTPIYATHNGIVGISGFNKAYGNQIFLNGSGGLGSRYAHLSRMTVQAGQQVSKGQIIGYSGNSGNSTGPHLHYGVYSNGRPVNPSGYF